MVDKVRRTVIELPHGRTILGRPIRPTAFGLMIIAAALGISSWQGRSLLLGSAFGQAIAALCTLAAAAYLIGWIDDRPALARVADLVVFFTFATQTIFLWIERGTDFPWQLLTLQPGTTSIWIGIGIAVIAAGAFWLNGRLE